MIPRTFAPAPGWSTDGHRIKAPLHYSRGEEKVWIYGALRVRDGKELTKCAAARNSRNYIELLKDIEADNPLGDLFIITDNLSSHNSLETRTWLVDHPRLQHVFIPKGACWLNLQEGWWRLFRRDAFAGQSFANADEIEQAMSQTMDLGTTTQNTAVSAPSLLLPPLRNRALNASMLHLRNRSRGTYL